MIMIVEVVYINDNDDQDHALMKFKYLINDNDNKFH